MKFILTNKLNQDPIENLFSLIRNKGGNNKNPSVLEFNRIIGRVVSNKFLSFACPTSNCVEDEDSFVILDEKENNFPLMSDSIINVSDMESEPEDLFSISENIYCNEEINVNYIENSSLRYFGGYAALPTVL